MPPRRATAAQTDIMRTDEGEDNIRPFKAEIEEGFRANSCTPAFRSLTKLPEVFAYLLF